MFSNPLIYIKSIFLSGIFLFVTCHSQQSSINKDLHIEIMYCEYQQNPLGIDNPFPRFTWIVNCYLKDGFQTAYQILVSDSPENLKENRGNIWDSGKVFSGKSAQVVYQGEKLRSRQKYYWKVRIWDNFDQVSIFSEIAYWEMGLLDPENWKSAWISPPRIFDWAKRDQQRKGLSKDAPPELGEPAPIFRKEFTLTGDVVNARAYVTGLGYYELYINEQKVGENMLDPAFTDYDKTVLYQTYDIVDNLIQDTNAIGIMLGNGWYDMFSRGVWSFDRASWRDDPAMRIDLQIEYVDGGIHIITSDSTWKCFPGPVIFNSIRQGEMYDARLEQQGWSSTGFDDSRWFPVRTVSGPKGTMVSQTLPPIRILDKLTPVNIYRTIKNTWICDFGQNIAGFAELSFSAQEGERIELKYGEKIYPNGTVDQSNIDGLVAQTPFQTDVYFTSGKGLEKWHPRFVYHGFRYIEIDGFPGDLTYDHIKACVVHTAFDKKAYFECSNPLINQIQKNTEWSFLNNFHGYPTDCPHREKNGWTGDAQLASEMALINYRVETAYDKWIMDIVDSQLQSGMIPSIVPTGGWGYHWGNGPAWDYALIILPWNMYMYSGDRQVLERYYPAIKKYLEFLSGTTEDFIIRWGLGDWVPARTVTPSELITTAYYYQDAIIVARIAETLGYFEDQEKYRNLAMEIKKAFNTHFVQDDYPLVGNGSQTSLGCALYFSLLDSVTTDLALQQLISNITDNDLNLDFGVLGSKFVPNALVLHDRIDVAYNMINTIAYPGWGNWVHRGATTLWEDWAGESSRNHVFFGDVSAWFYKYLAGIQPDENQPGFKHFYIVPYFAEDLEWVYASMDSYYGKIESSWRKNQQSTELMVQIPFNTSATIRLDEAKHFQVLEKESGTLIEPDITTREDQNIEIKLGAGGYILHIEE